MLPSTAYPLLLVDVLVLVAEEVALVALDPAALVAVVAALELAEPGPAPAFKSAEHVPGCPSAPLHFSPVMHTFVLPAPLVQGPPAPLIDI